MPGTVPNRIERLAVIVAMPSELQHLPWLPHVPERDDTPWPSVSWRQGEVEVTAVLCGIGMIPAAAATEATLAAYQPDAILNFGCTGSHRHDVTVGDVVIGTRAVAHATMFVAPEGTGRYHLHVGVEAPAPGETGIATDPALLAIARMAASGWAPDAWHGATGSNHAPRVHEGVVASADIWTQSHAGIAALAERHHSLCEDMEAGAIAAICALHGVPFLTIKDISNNELLQATIFDPEMGHLPEEEVGRRAAILTGRVIAAIASAG
jgi:adenosylhomocysteine nucleosidase